MGGWVRNTENKAQLRPARAGALSELGNSNPSIITNKDEFKIDVRNIAIELMENWHGRAAFQHSEFGRWTAGNDVVATIFSRPRQPFWGPPAAILDFAGGAALQAVKNRQTNRPIDGQTNRPTDGY